MQNKSDIIRTPVNRKAKIRTDCTENKTHCEREPANVKKKNVRIISAREGFNKTLRHPATIGPSKQLFDMIPSMSNIFYILQKG